MTAKTAREFEQMTIKELIAYRKQMKQRMKIIRLELMDMNTERSIVDGILKKDIEECTVEIRRLEHKRSEIESIAEKMDDFFIH